MSKITYIIIGGVVFFFVFTSLWAFVATLLPQKITSDTTPEDFNLEYEDIQLTTEDGLSLSGWFIPRQTEEEAEAREGADKAIVFTHGYPADKGDILPLTGFLAEDYNLLYFDFRGLGDSEGRYSSVGIHEQRDLRSAIDFLEERGYEEIGLWGFSVGAATALMQAPKEDTVEAVVSVSSYARLSDLADSLFIIPYIDSWLAELVRGYAYLVFGEDIRNISPTEAIADYQKPVFIIHPAGDQVIPPTHGDRLQEALSDNPQAQFWFPTGGHGYINPPEHQQRVRQFFESNL